jgi:ELWxxDGT repeat protein
LVVADGVLYVAVQSGSSRSHARTLWEGDALGGDIREVARFDYVAFMAALGPDLLVAGRLEGGQGIALWKLGSGGGAELLLDRRVTTSFAVHDGRAYFAAADPTHGTEPWRTDGTPEGTVMMADINPGPASSDPTDSGIGMSGFAVAGELLFFAASHPEYDIEPWVLPLDAEPPTESPCVPGDETLCLGDRFRITVDWRDFRNRVGAGHAVPLTADTGAFWFFGPGNLEVVVKVLDACASPWKSHWVFAAGLTNVEATMRVEDLEGNESRQYRNTLGTKFQPIQDTKAFETCP